MIRHSNSLFISIVIHVLIFFLIISSYMYVTTNTSQNLQEDVVCVQLRCYQESAPKKVEIQQEKKKTLVKKIEKNPTVSKTCMCDTPIVKKETPMPPVETINEEVAEEDVKMDETLKEPQEETALLETTQNIEEAQVITPQPLQASPEEKYIDQHLAEIVKLLQENLYYPRSARKRGITGTVLVEFMLAADASVKNIKILSSEKEILSNAAQTTIEDLSGKFPKPDKTLILKVPINYNLSQ